MAFHHRAGVVSLATAEYSAEEREVALEDQERALDLAREQTARDVDNDWMPELSEAFTLGDELDVDEGLLPPAGSGGHRRGGVSRVNVVFDEHGEVREYALKGLRADAEAACYRRAILLAPTIDVCEALLQGEDVPVSRLDPKWVAAFGLRRAS